MLFEVSPGGMGTSMNRLAVAISIFSIGTVSASAADLAARPYTKAPPVVVAAYDWSGFYIGANGGWAWSRKCWDINRFTTGVPPIVPLFDVFGPEGCHDASGATAGGQIGYRWQSASWVFGVEAQGNWANLSGSNLSENILFAGTGIANRSRIDAIGLFTAQVGYSWNNFLLYVKGGGAVARDKYDSFLTTAFGGQPPGFVVSRGSETRWGGVVGVGGEYAFSPNWSLALEYDHLFMGSGDVAMVYDPALFVPALLNHSEHIRQDVDMVTVRLNYRFGGPLIAKY
jgi:outer membrane immunogenic protein